MLDQARTRELGADVALGAGAVAIAGAAALWIFGGPNEATHVAVVPTTSGASVFVMGAL